MLHFTNVHCDGENERKEALLPNQNVLAATKLEKTLFIASFSLNNTYLDGPLMTDIILSQKGTLIRGQVKYYIHQN